MRGAYFSSILVTIATLFYTSSVDAQTYGNEWINYNQQYFSIKIVSDEVYRLDYNAMVAAGIPVSTFMTENIQLFAKEREVPIHVVDGGDSSLDPGDYILFYGEHNDGWLDSTLYVIPGTGASPSFSLYNDTLQYFFTWNTSINNYRYSLETDINYSAYTSSNYVLFSQINHSNIAYHDGVKQPNVSSSFFVPGEGWGSGKVNGVPDDLSQIYTALSPFPYAGVDAPTAKFELRSTTSSDAATTLNGPNHHLRWRLGTSGTMVLDTTFSGYTQVVVSAEIPAAEIGNGSTPIYFEIIDDLTALTDYQALTEYTITYPRQLNYSGSAEANFRMENNPSEGKIRLDMFNASVTQPLLFVHGDVPRMVQMVPSIASTYTGLIPNSANGIDQGMIFLDSSLIVDIGGNIVPVNANSSSPGYFTDFVNTFVLDSVLLMIYHESLSSSSVNYENYRKSSAGGGYPTILANVYELYQQYGGGIEKHINGIRRFAHEIYNAATIKPSGLFLMGKGIREADFESFTSDGPGARLDPSRFTQSLIPSFGHPSSDVAITAGLEGSSLWAPLVPTGRISARTASELQDYLNKVIEYEAAQDPFDSYNSPNKDWQKQILHFTGGQDDFEQNLFQSYMNTNKAIIEDSLYGGNVTNLFTGSGNPLSPTVLAGVTDRISQGVSLMSYFGHFSSNESGFEINLDEAANWNNSGKYPVMLVNACYNGNVFQLNNSSSEDFVQIANLGAIAYIASVHIGFAGLLNSYSNSLYDKFSRTGYGDNLGQQMLDNILTMEGTANTLFYESTSTQMILNGDPMIKLNWHGNPEIELTEEGVFFTPEQLDLTIDSIEMHIVLTNLGKAIVNTFSLEIIRDFPLSTTDSIYIFQIPSLSYKDTFSFMMPMQPNIGLGLNNFTISVDLPSVIAEQYDELSNNQLTKSLFIDVDGILPVIPFDYAVVPIDSVTVKASTINPVADFNTYRFEIDTTDKYNSTEHRYALVSGYGGVKEVHPGDWLSFTTNTSDSLVCGDSVVYFWRVALENPTPDWREFSFQHIVGKEGWGQDHFFQFKKNGLNGIAHDTINRNRFFLPRTSEIHISAYAAVPQVGWSIDNQWNNDNYGIGNFSPKLHVAVIDPLTLEPWYTKFTYASPPSVVNPSHDFGNNNNDVNSWWARPMNIFTFLHNDPAQLSAFQNLILNEVPDSHYIIIYSPFTTYETWDAIDSANMYNIFSGLGSDSIYAGRPNTAFAFFCKKGDPNSVREIVAQYVGEFIAIDDTIVGSLYEGVETSTRIGPAADWGTVTWKQDPSEVSSADSTHLTINAYDITGAFQTSIDTVFTANDSILNLGTFIDANLYPYINLQAYHIDTNTNTPSQIDRWHVLYSPLPEAAIDGTSLYTWTHSSDTIPEGETFDFAVDVKNIFTIDMDSLLISYWVEDANQVVYPIAYERQGPLLVGDVFRDTITVPTTGLAGISSFWMEVNPYVNGSLYITDQPEQEHFNNLLQLPFYVTADEKNPILDVTFNGRHILNGDIVDPFSDVLITLKDDNEFLIMDDISDTTLFGVYLTDPNGVQVRVPFVDNSGTTIMQWLPADSQSKRFKIMWPSEFTLDGTYQLFVQGADRSGNLSGDLEYRVSFEIVHEASITQMMNYPNPFTTSTRFVFTLTGSEEPDEILIQIMTVSGRVIREITEDQLGQIYIGRNITEYAWDGTDEFGDPLANGVYLYTVKAQINGEDILRRDSGADQHFKKGFGKMYLMR